MAIGPGEILLTLPWVQRLNFTRLIPETVVAALDGRPPVIRSDGSPERDFLHVDDAVSAYLAIEGALGEGAAAKPEVAAAAAG